MDFGEGGIAAAVAQHWASASGSCPARPRIGLPSLQIPYVAFGSLLSNASGTNERIDGSSRGSFLLGPMEVIRVSY